MSPYLRSHAGNPVDWYEWGDEAFTAARERDVPVLISIGYSTCHWCHVMARESFSDPALSAVLNAGFVAIKVDREEYPDVDSSYLAAASAFTENLGWPLNVFATPEGKPFFAGTYFPPSAVGQVPAFRSVLGAIEEAWQNSRADVETSAGAVAAALRASAVDAAGALPTNFAGLVAELESYEDTEFGGFGTAPKFPVATVMHLLLDLGSALGPRTLDAMAASPLRDPIEGGFFRYATRRDWSDPHYERMLHENALLLGAYARAGRREIAAGIAGYLLDVSQLPGGGFASAQDSESTVDGVRVEGGYYALSAERRAEQVAPALDEKLLTGWNGLAIENLALAGRLLDEPAWIEAARRAADLLLSRPIARASSGDRRSAAPATLEDYGMLASGLLELAIATGEVHYAMAARDLVDASAAVVPDATLAGHGLALDSDLSEGAYPSGVSAAAGAANTLYLLGAGSSYRLAARSAMERFAPLAVQRPIAFGAALGVMAALAAGAAQLVVVGQPAASIARHWQHTGAVSIAVTRDQAREWAAAGFELFEGRDGRDAAYYCRDFVCRLPVATSTELLALLPE
ncbi:thioredoxin domain-containing protein [soil metagenome]